MNPPRVVAYNEYFQYIINRNVVIIDREYSFQQGVEEIDRRNISRELVDIVNDMENIQSNRNFVVVEMLVLSGFIGYYLKSWAAVFISVVVLAILLVIPVLRIVVFLLLSAAWGAIAYVILGFFVSTSTIAILGAISIFVLVFLIHKSI
jgi:hypothetical protein